MEAHRQSRPRANNNNAQGLKMLQGLDLFGDVPVTTPDLHRWCEEVAGIDPHSPRAADYIRSYDVPAKVARAKLSGEW